MIRVRRGEGTFLPHHASAYDTEQEACPRGLHDRRPVRAVQAALKAVDAPGGRIKKTLRSHTAEGQRFLVRLEQALWPALDAVAERQGLNRRDVCLQAMAAHPDGSPTRAVRAWLHQKLKELMPPPRPVVSPAEPRAEMESDAAADLFRPLKLALMAEITRTLKVQKLAPDEAARRLVVPPQVLTGIQRRSLSGISERRLLDCLLRLGHDVELTLRPAPAPAIRPGTLTLTITPREADRCPESRCS